MLVCWKHQLLIYGAGHLQINEFYISGRNPESTDYPAFPSEAEGGSRSILYPLPPVPPAPPAADVTIKAKGNAPKPLPSKAKDGSKTRTKGKFHAQLDPPTHHRMHWSLRASACRKIVLCSLTTLHRTELQSICSTLQVIKIPMS